jgi:hypothetical protein
VRGAAFAATTPSVSSNTQPDAAPSIAKTRHWKNCKTNTKSSVSTEFPPLENKWRKAAKNGTGANPRFSQFQWRKRIRKPLFFGHFFSAIKNFQ